MISSNGSRDIAKSLKISFGSSFVNLRALVYLWKWVWKGILTLVRMGVKFENNNVEIGIDMYIYSWSGRKKRTFSKNFCLVARPSVRPCAKVMYTKTQERIKIIECGYFCLKGVYWESKLWPERTKIYEARAEWNF